MDKLMNTFQDIFPKGFDYLAFFKMAAIFTLGSILFAAVGRIAFGKKSALCQSVSSAIGILFIYIVTVLIHTFGLDLNSLISPLPFFKFHISSAIGDAVEFFVPLDNYVLLCGELLNMVILAFLANLVNSWIPHGKKLFGWLLFRVISVAVAMILFAVFNWLMNYFLPEGLLTWAPVILLGLLVIMLLVGALKGVVGAVIASFNPLAGFLYTFFFATLIGKMLTRAMLTTLLLAGLICVLKYFGVAMIAIGSSVLVAYLPLLIILLIIWYIVGKLL